LRILLVFLPNIHKKITVILADPSRRQLARTDEHWLVAAGNTFCYPAGRREARAVLVVGNTLTCHFWLNILPMLRDDALRLYITIEDLQALDGRRLRAHGARRRLAEGSRLYVRPTMIPSFLVLDADGFPVDWFPAPLPVAGAVADPAALLAAVRRQLAEYVPSTIAARRAERPRATPATHPRTVHRP
jgi:hypothetical protein